MKHRQLEAFRNVMRTGTTAQAAEMMSVTQPAVSRLIADLEIHLDFKLFERNKGRLTPTPEALRFYRGVDQFFIGIDALEQSAAQIRERCPLDLRICATPALSTGLLPQAVAEFRKLHKNVAIDLETASFSQIALRLQTQQSNLGVSHAFPVLPGIEQQTLAAVEHVCAVHASHPLATRDVISPEDLAGENVLRILPQGSVNWEETKTVLESAKIPFNSDIGTQSSHTGYALIAQNLAVGLIEPFAATPWLQNDVVIRPFAPRLEYTYVVARSKEQPSSHLIDEFVEVLQKMIKRF